jgi:large subunit ribosomal protein L9
MKIILKQDIEKLGDIGDVVEVSDGYARNYLLPRGLAVEATKGNLKSIETEKKAKSKKEEKLTDGLKKIAEDIAKKPYSISRKAGEEDKLFGAVTTADISDVLKENGFDIDKKKIILESPLHELGEFSVKVKLHKNVIAEIKVCVVKE